MDQLQLKNPSDEDRDKDKEKPRVVISFAENEERDMFYSKMIAIIGYKKRKRSKSHSAGYKSHSATETEKERDEDSHSEYKFDYELYNTLDVVIQRQGIYNEYLSISMEKTFPFLNAAKGQAIQMTHVDNKKYILALTRDDIKHIKAYYRSKPDNFEIRNNRKQWFIDCWCATKLFEHCFPISISSQIESLWIQQLCRASIYFMTDAKMNQRCIELMDSLMKTCFGNKYIKPIDTFFHEKDYQNLQMLCHLMSNYINLHSSTHIPKFRFVMMIPLLIKNDKKCSADYAQYFIDLITIPIVNKQFKETDIYQCIVQYMQHMKANAREINVNDRIIVTLTQMLQQKDKKINKIWPQNSLHLQEIVSSNNADVSYTIDRLQVNLMIDPQLIHTTYPNQYDGLNALQYAQQKKVSSTIIEFLQNKLEGAEVIADAEIDIPGAARKEQPQQSDCEDRNYKEGDSMVCASLLMAQDDDNDNENENASFISLVTKSPKKAPVKLNTKTKKKSPKKDKHTMTTTAPSPSWGFTHFVGHCFSFTQLAPGNTGNTNPHTIAAPQNGCGSAESKQYDLQRKLQSYVTTLDKFKAKTRNLEHKIAKLNKEMDKQNEKIIELKLENKMLKNTFMNNEANKSNDCDDNEYVVAHVNKQQWKAWSSLDIIHWICALQNGRFKKYQNTLKVNLKLRNIQGLHLSRIEKSDLTYFYGIVDFDDVCDLYQE
eukprot:296005_1